ncbi:type II toxin-antitoxin system HicA family toxin [Hymenobacter puniceus]|uniref:type II toxin-antitoxin system HicA family toxin n=1 Tax=Hymenobacter sp. BT190 TaxID=2763505 RepID=UPI0016516334|nr:type II toxin-antitoxin system HicA family toxin [Hymenobacter sp. BT190]MBC6700176.1 type II toxin-antitoxin system HicA family toxin [Hymenobacter sp. BT190]
MKSSQLLRKLKAAGWFVVRQNGSHVIMRHPTLPGTLVVPSHGSAEVGKGLASKILKDAGLA